MSSDPWDLDLTKKSAIPFEHLPRFDSEAALDLFRQEMPSTPTSQQIPTEIAKLVGDSIEIQMDSPQLSMLCSGVFPSQNPLTPEESQWNEYASPADPRTNNLIATSTQKDQTTPRVEREKLKKTRLVFSQVEPKETEDDELEAIGGVKKRNRRLQFSGDHLLCFFTRSLKTFLTFSL